MLLTDDELLNLIWYNYKMGGNHMVLVKPTLDTQLREWQQEALRNGHRLELTFRGTHVRAAFWRDDHLVHTRTWDYPQPIPDCDVTVQVT